jgi:transposase
LKFTTYTHPHLIKTILLLDKGYSFQEIADILLFNEKTGRRYYSEYSEDGLDRLITDNYQNYTGKRTPDQEQKLCAHLREVTYSSSKGIAIWIENQFGVKYSFKGIVHTLHRLGFSYKKSKLVPSKADPDKQLKFIEEYEKLKSELGTNDKIYFVDGVHQLHNAETDYGWIPTGEDKEVPANTGRERLNINGALEVQSKEVIVREDDRINAQSTIALFKSIELKNPESDKIIVIADNAKYYKNKMVNEFLDTSKIEIKFLPPYSQNLNLIERLWKFFKKKVMLNAYYDTYSAFKKAGMVFFEDISQYKEELDSLITENFQIIGEPD